MSTSDTDAHHVIGSLQDAATELYDELLTTGSSVLLSDVVKIMIVNVKKYAGWSGELQHCPKDDESCVKPLLTITANTVLGVDDWIIIEPVVRAHCDLVQARRMEGAQGLGVQPAGMSSSEALQYYKESLETMKREAFQCQPFSIDMPTRIKVTREWELSTSIKQHNCTINVSSDPNNIIRQKHDGIYADVPTPDDNSGFVEAFQSAMSEDD